MLYQTKYYVISNKSKRNGMVARGLPVRNIDMGVCLFYLQIASGSAKFCIITTLKSDLRSTAYLYCNLLQLFKQNRLTEVTFLNI